MMILFVSGGDVDGSGVGYIGKKILQRRMRLPWSGQGRYHGEEATRRKGEEAKRAV